METQDDDFYFFLDEARQCKTQYWFRITCPVSCQKSDANFNEAMQKH
jgi:hypothetical protein